MTISSKITLMTALFLGGLNLSTYAQNNWQHTEDDRKAAVDVDTLQQKGFTLYWINKDKDFNPELKQKLIDVHFKNYPKFAKDFNKDTRKEVSFVIDPDYDGIAATAGGIVRFNPVWFQKHPGDIDIVTHEVMHIAQAYPNGAGPWWITEGIADYIRYAYGVDNAGANWSLPELTQEHHYDSSYRITARFFAWIEKNKKKGFVKKLDAAMRTKTYSEDFWKNQTGSTVQELWEEYKADPNL